MAINDIAIVKGHYGVEVFDIADRTTTSVTTVVQPGEPVKRATNTSTNSALPLATGDAEEAVDIFLGIAKEESTETSTVVGKVNVELVGPGTVIEARPTTATNVDTAAKLLLVQGDFVCLDLTGAGTNGPTGVFTIDEDEGDDPNVHTGIILSNSPISSGMLRMLICHATLFYSTV